MASGLPPPPTRAASGDFAWVAWYNQLYALLSTTGAVAWSQVSKAGSSIADLQNHNHNLLTSMDGGAIGQYYHLTSAEHSTLVLGPAAAVNNSFAAFDTTTGKLLKDSGYSSTSFVSAVTGTAPVVSSGGVTPAISMPAATTLVSGYLTSTDWNTFNGKQTAGTYVTSLTVTGANGFAGSFTSGATPALTISTSITGLLKGNGTALLAAVANTDYVPLSTVLTKTADYTITNTDTWIINNKTGAALTLTFPAASAWTGRSITIKNMQAQLVNSSSSNIVPLDSVTAGTAILLGVIGNWAKLVSDGTNWVIMQSAANNILLLE